MGLDNIPHVYPCKKVGTAVTVTKQYEDEEPFEQIDCDATIAAGGCPWIVKATNHGTPAYGMLGTPCWYRGKVGTWMLEELINAGYTDMPGGIEGFYGSDAMASKDGVKGDADLTPEHCVALATWMEDHAEAYGSLHKGDPDGGKGEIEAYRYAAWWLRFVATDAEGADAWW